MGKTDRQEERKKERENERKEKIKPIDKKIYL